MRWRQPLMPPGQLPPPPGRWDPPPLDCRDNGAAARRRRSLARTATALIPAIVIGTLFILREDWEGNGGSGVATEDDDDTDAEAGGYAYDFLEVDLRQLLEGRFGRRRTTMKTTEVSRDNKHKEDVVTQSMFAMLCEGKPLLSSSTARPKRQSSAMTAARAVGRIRRGRNDHGRGDDDGNDGLGDASVMTMTTNEYIPCIKRQDNMHNSITLFVKKHIICLIICN